AFEGNIVLQRAGGQVGNCNADGRASGIAAALAPDLAAAVPRPHPCDGGEVPRHPCVAGAQRSAFVNRPANSRIALSSASPRFFLEATRHASDCKMTPSDSTFR